MGVLRFRVAVLEATGLVGQRFVSLLARHPWFELVALVASGRSADQRFRDAVRWVIEQPLPDAVADIKVEPLEVNVISSYKPDILFSALPSKLY
jgi:aspartate-semialdehyde dehydrogenase